MSDHELPGLPADWVNAWLAALGVAVLLPDARLRWTDDPRPVAVVGHLTADVPALAAAVAEALPSVEELAHLVVAKQLGDLPALGQNFRKDDFAARADAAREAGDWTLGAFATDAVRDDEPAKAPFNPPAPKGLTLHDRLVACRGALGDSPGDALAASFAGRGERVKLNGLGFDATRILVSSDPKGDKWVDPAIETLAFFGLAVVPCRGDGRQLRARGWHDGRSRRGAFRWPTWEPALSAPAVDGLLDHFWAVDAVLPRRAVDPAVGRARWPAAVRRVYGVVPYQPQGSSDVTRGYASEVVR